MGNNLVTIVTRDSIKVVRPEEIFRAGSYGSAADNTNTPEYQTTPYYNNNTSQTQQETNPYYQEQLPMTMPPINITPVIKVFNHGNDMSSTQQQTEEISNDNNTLTPPAEVEEVPVAEEQIIDFSRPLLIKKT